MFIVDSFVPIGQKVLQRENNVKMIKFIKISFVFHRIRERCLLGGRRRSWDWWDEAENRVNSLMLAVWSPGLGSALQGEYRSVWHLSRPGDAEQSPTFDPIRTQAWASTRTLFPPEQTRVRFSAGLGFGFRILKLLEVKRHLRTGPRTASWKRGIGLKEVR